MSCQSPVILLVTLLYVAGHFTDAAPRRMRRDAEESTSNSEEARRNDKQLPFYQFVQPSFLDYGVDGDNEVLSRAEPLNRKPYPDSPIYYIRMPPTPYVFVPGLGYVSQPPPPPPAMSPFINVPIEFVSNGKPTGVYQWSQPITPSVPRPPPPPPQPAADSPVTNLDKGPYVFNGRPSDIYILRNSYNSLYSDALQNFYP